MLSLTSSCLPADSSALAGTLKVDKASILLTAACSKAAALALCGVLKCCPGEPTYMSCACGGIIDVVKSSAALWV